MIMRFAAAVAASILSVASAHTGGTTQPVPVVPTVVPVTLDWSGAYAGLSFASVDPRATSTIGAANNSPFEDDTAFGVFGGYLFQSGALVYGGELGYTAFDSDFAGFPGFSIGDILEVRGRVGYATGRLLLSASIGYARQEYVGVFTPVSINMDGMTYGLGLDYAVTDRVFVGLEYVVRDIEGAVTQPVPTQMGVEDESLRLRVGLRF